MRLIDADPIMQRLTYNNGTPTVDNYRDGAPVTLALREIKDLIQNAPTVSLWVKTADRLPTEADANKESKVLGWIPGYGYRGADYKFVIGRPEHVTWWMPFPSRLEVEE